MNDKEEIKKLQRIKGELYGEILSTNTKLSALKQAYDAEVESLNIQRRQYAEADRHLAMLDGRYKRIEAKPKQKSSNDSLSLLINLNANQLKRLADKLGIGGN